MIHQAFAAGDPQRAWDAVRALLREVRQFSIEAAQDRFRHNLGSPLCRSCEGLKAGPDVAATCFQLGQCFFTNRKVTDVTESQQGLISRLVRQVSK